jgi:hypothetical protein
MVQILLGRGNTGKAGAGKRVLLTLDACLQQEPHHKNQVTRYPVEEGLDVTDHVRMEPDTIKIEGQVSNTPDTTVQTSTGDRVINAYEMLLKISGREILHSTSEYLDEFPGPILIDLIVSNRVMVDMICEDLSIPRDPQTGDVINFTMQFVKVRKATVDLASITYTSNAIGGAGTTDQTQPTTDKGKQQTNEPSTNNDKAFDAWWNGTIDTKDYKNILIGAGSLDSSGKYVSNGVQ